MRVLEPAKLNKYRIARYMGIEDAEDLGSCVGFLICLSIIPTAVLSAVISLWFLLIFAIPFLPALITLPYFIGSHYMLGGLYEDAIRKYKELTQESVKAEGMILLSSIWTHERAYGSINKGHAGKWDCRDCYDRVQLLDKLAQTQSLPALDRSDIEAIEARLSARKELGL